MQTYNWLKALHILMVVIWIGTDIGTFASFQRLLNTKLSVPTRLSMNRLSNLLDQGPRSALVILLMLGVTMTNQGGWGLQGDGGKVLSVASTVIGLVWFAGVWHQYWVGHPPSGLTRSPAHVLATARFRQVDLYWRAIVGVVLFVVGLTSLLNRSDGGLIAADWLSWKLILFSGIIADGVLIRILLPKLGGAIVAIATNGSSPEREETLAKHGRTAKFYVGAIWLFLVAMSALAVMKPGADVTGYGLLKTVHVLSMCLWLGVDLGVFLSAKLSLDASLSGESRLQFAKLFGELDLGPRVVMLATIPLGLSLAHLRWGFLQGRQGVAAGLWVLASVVAVWAFCVIRQHTQAASASRFLAVFAKVDTGLRVFLIVGFLWLGATQFGENADGTITTWIGIKALLFAAMVACGLWIRWGLRQFGPAYGATLAPTATREQFTVAQRMVASVYAPVWLIWAGIAVNIVVATLKPFS
jgi:hypothetical protein